MSDFRRMTIHELVAEVLAEGLPGQKSKRGEPSPLPPASPMQSWTATSVLPRATVRTRDGVAEVSFSHPQTYSTTLVDRALELALAAAAHRPMDALDEAFRIDADAGFVLTYLLARYSEWFTEGTDPSKEEKAVDRLVEELFG